MARIATGKNSKQGRDGNFEISKVVTEMVKDMDEQLMAMADEKVSYERLRNGNVNTWLIKLDQYTRHLAIEIKQSKEAEVKAKKIKRK